MNVDMQGEILNYINRNETTGALLLTGKWGCGKSYLVKKIAKDQEKDKKAAMAIVSLFGLDSVAAVNKSVKDMYLGFQLGALDKVNNRFTHTITKFIKDGLEVASKAANGNAALSAASHGLSSVMSYDVLGFIEIRNTIGKDDKARKFVIVFDDLERSNLGKRELLGAINEYVENKQIKIIIIADEDKLDGDEYKEYKEKLIARTIRMSTDYDSLIDEIIDRYNETAEGYKSFLNNNSAILKQVFAESQSDNLRILKAAIADFERVYGTWKKSSIDTDNMKWALYTFTAGVYGSRLPQKKENSDEAKKTSLDLSFRKKEEQYKNIGKNLSIFQSFSRWINDGIWSEELFLEELRIKYGKDESTPVERFLHCRFWDLQQQDINDGFPKALQFAYEGMLSRDDLITFLKYVHYLKIHSIELPCEIDYKKIEDGFIKHMEMIKRNEINDPVQRTFTENSEIDSEAYSINSMIEKSENVLVAWNNRSQLLDFLHNPLESQYRLRNLCIEEFDDELLEIFEACYSRASNANKREFALALIGLAFDSSSYSTDENIENSKKSFRKLIEWLDSQNSEDGITNLINESFISAIKESSMMSNKSTND